MYVYYRTGASYLRKIQMGESMKKFKDFIYDKNDIIIAVLILVAAALIICWRVNVILEYPKQLLGNDGNPAVENPVDNVDEEVEI